MSRRRGAAPTGARSPTELLAASLASCTAITIEMYANRKEWGLGTVEVAVDYTEATTDDPPTFDVRITLGAQLSDENRDRLLTIAGKCPVHRALKSQDVVRQRLAGADRGLRGRGLTRGSWDSAVAPAW